MKTELDSDAMREHASASHETAVREAPPLVLPVIKLGTCLLLIFAC